jgi:hypothetical protein
MGFFRGLFRFIIGVLIIAIGVLAVLYEKEEILTHAENLYSQFLNEAPEIPIEGITYRQILGGIITLVGLILVWLVLVPKRRPRSVTFTGTHGEVTIELEPVEATLERIAMKLPEVKNISIQLKPLEGNGRIQVLAVAILSKNADDDARMVTARVHNFLQIHTRKIVGLQEVDAKLTVKKFNMNMKSVKPEPLLLDAPDTAVQSKSTHTSSTPIAAPVPAAPVVAPQSTSLESIESPTLEGPSGDQGRVSKY